MLFFFNYIAGSIIMTDGWRSYINLNQYPLDQGDLKYKHYVVNHSIEHVNSEGNNLKQLIKYNDNDNDNNNNNNNNNNN